MPFLSIITICYNDAKGLEETLKSIDLQNFRDFEVLVVDGGSTDGSTEVIHKYSFLITWHISEKDHGIYNAQNKGLSKARGKYCLFLNSGDYLASPDVLQKFYDQHPDSAIVYGNMVVSEKGKLVYSEQPYPIPFENMIAGTLWHPASFIKRELFELYGNYNEKYRIISDYEFFLKTIFVHRVSTSHIPVYISVFNTEGIGSDPKYKELHDKEKKEVHEKYFHPGIIKSAKELYYLKRSRGVLAAKWIADKPVLKSFALGMYRFLNTVRKAIRG